MELGKGKKSEKKMLDEKAKAERKHKKNMVLTGKKT